MDANWTGDQNNFEAFGLHDTAQLVAQGQLNNDEQSIEINLQNNQLMNGTAKAYQVRYCSNKGTGCSRSCSKDRFNAWQQHLKLESFGCRRNDPRQ